MPKYFTEPENIKDGFIEIFSDEAKHILNVMRMEIGDTLTICDGQSNDYLCRICETGKNCLKAKIEETTKSESEPKTKITLYQGLPKSDKMELIIQKCVEIGVCRIVPVITERAVVKIEKGAKEDKKTERWQKIAESAAKQSGRGIIPAVERPMKFKDAIEEAVKNGEAIIPYENEKDRGLKEFVKNSKAENVGIFIGPEGGFDTKEIEFAVENGVMSVTLGKRILRTETAGIVTSAIVLYELG